jgi:uncharacterized protein (TIGR02466 family)
MIALSIEDLSAQRERAIEHARRGELDTAIAMATRLLEHHPQDVLTIAYLGSFLHHAGQHEKCDGIFAFADQIAWRRDIHAECAGLESNAQLAALVLDDPHLAPGRPSKATKGGRQTKDLWPSLTARAPRFSRYLVAAIASELREFGFEVPEGPDAERYFKVTAWGVALDSGGFQLPHVHPSGLLSGVYYVRVPPFRGTTHAGQLRFRKRAPWVSPSEQAADDGAFHVLPQEGSLVLFPSYFWHDTIPFEADSARISIAFDVLPPTTEIQEHD